ncbi:MAG: succinate dehydrogenase, cytochrome b556 subunit [Rhodobacterales bacterium]|nr:MAG: succinate dehydrogenase, cytochrome b556 subunit [Rhodobacterales bacterium]
MADVNRGDRPLSPHLSIYRPQWTSVTSIFTRITGNALIVTAILIVWWFAALAHGPEAYARANGVLTCWFGDLVMFLSLAGLYYHMLAGIRHLIWASGRMLGVGESERFAYIMVIGAVILTIFTAVIV